MVVAISTPLKRGATYADLEALPDRLLGQIVGGDLYATPRPAGPHVVTSSIIGMVIGPPFSLGQGGPGGWWILDEPELHLGADILVPDLAGWRTERMPSAPTTPAIELAPDWICEVLSPSTAVLDRGPKLQTYWTANVGHVWFVDPLDRTVEVLCRGARRWEVEVSTGGAARVRLPPFDAVELDLSRWWAGDPSPAV